MDPTALHPRQAPRAGSRLHPARDPGPGPGDCHRQPPAGPLGRQSLASRRHSVPTFEQAATKVFAMYRPNWRSAHHAAQWKASLRGYVYPKLGRMASGRDHHGRCHGRPVTDLEHQAGNGRRVRQRISTVMKWAIAQGYRMDNPAGEALGAALPKTRRHPTALQGAALWGSGRCDPDGAAIRGSRGVKLGFEFLVLTACRSGEMRGARWDEIDLEAATWTVPPERMKHRREHRVPLSARAREILAEAGRIESSSGLVFSVSGGRSAAGPGSQHPAAGVGNRGRAAWVPLVVPGLGGRGDRCAACGDGGGVVARDPQPGGSGLRPLGPVRAPARPDGAVGRVPGRGPEIGRCLSWPLSCVAPLWSMFRPGLRRRYDGLPARDHCGGSDPRKGEGRWWILACTTSPCPVPHQRQKTGGRSLHFLPLRCGATTRRARGWDMRCRRRTGLYPIGFGESVPTRVQYGFPDTTWTTTARASPCDSADL